MDTSSSEVAELAVGWLDKCQREHEDCHIPKSAILPSRLVEVSNHGAKVCNTNGKMGAYVALSHCWGLNPIIRTEKASLADRMVDIPWNALSKTFQDAIMFTWKLGYKYIWIDSLVSFFSFLKFKGLLIKYSALFKTTKTIGKFKHRRWLVFSTTHK